jgi:hypothetical protein
MPGSGPSRSAGPAPNTSAAAAARNAAGTLTYNAGVIDADTVIIGDDNNTANTASGTGALNVNGAALLAVNNSMVIGRRQNAGGAVGTLTVSGRDRPGARERRDHRRRRHQHDQRQRRRDAAGAFARQLGQSHRYAHAQQRDGRRR